MRDPTKLILLCSLLVISGGAWAGMEPIPSAASGGTVGTEWRNYNGTLDGQRFSRLNQINVGNVGNLKEICRLQVEKRGTFQSGIIVVDQTMYITTLSSTIALDPATCAVKWRYEYKRTTISISPANRGAAYYAGRIFRGTDDGHVIALDAETGKEAWQNVVGDASVGECVDGAPIAWNGLVIFGIAPGDIGIRGRIVAFDAATGREVWRFNTVPAEGERGAETWKGKHKSEQGGGGTWSTFTIDPSTGELFVPVGNPAPAFSLSDRPGENLFTNSVVVLDANTGKLRWWFQFDPDDGFDRDLSAAPLLFRTSDGEQRLAAAGKDGYLQIISRRTHQLLSKTPVTTVEPQPRHPTPEGVLSCPGITGGVEWNGPAFDPLQKTIVVGAVDWCSIYQTVPGQKWSPVTPYYGGSWHPTSDPQTGWITAINAETGVIRWKYHAEAQVVGGVTPTAGGITFAGDNAGNFFAFETSTGRVLYQIKTGGSIAGGVITYDLAGKQYVALTSGNSSHYMYGTTGRPTVIVMALLDGAAPISESRRVDAVNGKAQYLAYCAGCHGADGRNVLGVDLPTVKVRKSAQELIDWIKDPAPPMPKIVPEPRDADDDADIRDIAEYLRHWQ